MRSTTEAGYDEYTSQYLYSTIGITTTSNLKLSYTQIIVELHNPFVKASVREQTYNHLKDHWWLIIIVLVPAKLQTLTASIREKKSEKCWETPKEQQQSIRNRLFEQRRHCTACANCHNIFVYFDWSSSLFFTALLLSKIRYLRLLCI